MVAHAAVRLPFVAPSGEVSGVGRLVALCPFTLVLLFFRSPFSGSPSTQLFVPAYCRRGFLRQQTPNKLSILEWRKEPPPLFPTSSTVQLPLGVQFLDAMVAVNICSPCWTIEEDCWYSEDCLKGCDTIVDVEEYLGHVVLLKQQFMICKFFLTNFAELMYRVIRLKASRVALVQEKRFGKLRRPKVLNEDHLDNLILGGVDSIHIEVK
ncbi:hypothetical protein HPP92_003683 [Vanilla planifolia]|uniref:Uncharacterized protein n=1 Tax=Vanilla planifolia TaxID=51239 RepID=A0A835SCC2_VANPL|nr:hypothetical protein HPP92_003683 [Vanilla planifolia]